MTEPNIKHKTDANERQQVARADLAALLSRVHDRPTQLTPQQIEDEITAARDEVRRQKRLKIEERTPCIEEGWFGSS